MKIAVFENEYDSVKGAFEAANLIEFNNLLEIENFTSSQNYISQNYEEYTAIFVDIDLSSKSELDGFSLIEKIKSINEDFVSKIIILTGNNKITEVLKERKIFSENIQIIIKPTNYKEVIDSINLVKSK